MDNDVSKRNRVEDIGTSAVAHEVRFVLPKSEAGLRGSLEPVDLVALRKFETVSIDGVIREEVVATTKSGGILWLRKMPRGFVVVKFDLSVNGPITCASNATNALFAIAREKDAQTEFLVCQPQTKEFRPLGLIDCRAGSMLCTTTHVLCSSADTTVVHCFEVADDGIRAKRTIRLTPSPIRMFASIADNYALAADSRGVVEIFSPKTWMPVVPGKDSLFSWTSKGQTDLLTLARGRVKQVLDVAVAPGGLMFAVVTVSSQDVRRCAIFDVRSASIRTELDLDGFDEITQDSVAAAAQKQRSNERKQAIGGHITFAKDDQLLVVLDQGVGVFDIDRHGASLRCVSFCHSSRSLGYPVCLSRPVASTQATRDLCRFLTPPLSDVVGAQSTTPCETLIAVVAPMSTHSELIVTSSTMTSDVAQRLGELLPLPTAFFVAKTSEQPESTRHDMLVTSAEIQTSMGTIGLELFPKEAPKAVHNFAELAQRGFYRGLTFHRVIKNFMIQGGCPRGDGTGGESAFGSPFEDEVSSDRPMAPFSLCMANRGANTNESQFFITTAATTWLQGKHTIFGRVVSGSDVVRAIETVPTEASNDRPREPVLITSVDVA